MSQFKTRFLSFFEEKKTHLIFLTSLDNRTEATAVASIILFANKENDSWEILKGISIFIKKNFPSEVATRLMLFQQLNHYLCTLSFWRENHSFENIFRVN